MMKSGHKTTFPLVAVDTWVLGSRNHGVQVYTKNLLTRFRELAPKYSVEVAPYLGVGMDGYDGWETAEGFKPRPTRLLQHSRVWRFGGAWARAWLDGVDTVFNPNCTSLYTGFPVPLVTTIHDVIPVVLPWRSPHVRRLRFLIWAAAKASREIITVSERSKRDIINACGVPEERIHVIYNGCDHKAFNDGCLDAGLLREAKLRLEIDRPYIFHCGSIKPNKNIKRLILAHRALLERNPNLQLDLVLAGTPDSGYDEAAAAARENASLRGRAILTGGLDQSDLVVLMKSASVAVFPSLYEGFCMPMVESMACGVPTIAAGASCLPEISGGMLRYFNPESVEEMASCMEAVLKSEALRAELTAQGRRQARHFDWNHCAQQTLAVLARAAGVRVEKSARVEVESDPAARTL